LAKHDLLALLDHIIETIQGDFAAAARRLDEIDAHFGKKRREPSFRDAAIAAA
jgi:hypothetical protein